MDNLKRKEDEVTAETAETEVEEKAAPDLGKFKDVKTLLEAYSVLEAEFTRRSQKLKELENANKETVPPTGRDEAPSRKADEPLAGDIAALDEITKNAVIEEYLSGIFKNKGVPYVAGGGVVVAEKLTPRTTKEAGKLAKNYFENKEN